MRNEGDYVLPCFLANKRLVSKYLNVVQRLVVYMCKSLGFYLFFHPLSSFKKIKRLLIKCGKSDGKGNA